MSLFLKRIITFSFAALLGYSLILGFWSNVIPFQAFKKNMNYKLGSYGHLNTRLKEADTISNIDILILGSSHAYRGFDPRIFREAGVNVFVLGSSSQTPIQAIGLIKEYLPKINPQKVIYEVYPGIFQNDGVESSLDIIANHSLNWYDIQMAFRVRHLKTFNVLINDLFREFFGLNKSFEEELINREDMYVSGGFVEKIDGKKNQKPVKENRFNLMDKQLSAFQDITNFLKEAEVDYLLVQAPSTSFLYKSRQNNAEVDSLLSTYGKYVNFNGKLKLNDSIDFYDNHHLSQSGVIKFNKELLEWLIDDGFIE